jgi:hypothetical protein
MATLFAPVVRMLPMSHASRRFLMVSRGQNRHHPLAMSKKAGPRRIDPDTFLPVVWVAEHDGTAFLVCQRRMLQLRPLTGVSKQVVATAEWFIHGAAIRMPPDMEILLGLQLSDGRWRGENPLDFGISKRCAQIALAEAWHGVKQDIDSVTMSAHLSCDGAKWSSYKKGVRVRNIIAAMHWDQWNKENVSLEDRASFLVERGKPCTAAQLQRFAEERGI